MTETPPDWVLLEAAKRSGWYEDYPLKTLKFSYENNCIYRALCDMILKHEQPPVDRKVLCAREACAERYEEDGLPAVAARRREGKYDNNDREQAAALRAIELYESGFGK